LFADQNKESSQLLFVLAAVAIVTVIPVDTNPTYEVMSSSILMIIAANPQATPGPEVWHDFRASLCHGGVACGGNE
jgi:hypothetical protein